MSCQASYDEVQTAVLADDFEHSAGKHRHYDQVSHSADSASDAFKPSAPVQASLSESDHGIHSDSYCQHSRDIHTGDGKDYHENIWNQQYKIHSTGLRNHGNIPAEEYIQQCHYESGWPHDPEIDLELVRHGTLLCACRRNGRVRDEREIIAEEGSSHDYGSDHRLSRSYLLSDSSRNRNKGHNGSHTCSYGHRYEARGQEQTGIEELPWQYPQCKIDCRIDGSDLLCCGGKCSGQDEYPYHQQHIPVAGPPGEYAHPFFQTFSSADEDTIDGSQQKGSRDRNPVEIVCYD